MANQELSFDITKLGNQQEKQQYIVSRVGDGGLKAITISVTSNGTPYNITDLTPIFEGVKPDGERIIDTTGGIVLNAKGGIFRYILPQQASTAEGDYQQAFFKLKRGEQTDSTIEVQMRVLKNKVEFGINSESYFTEYQKELERLRKTVEAGIKEINNSADGTKNKVQNLVDTANMLDLQIKSLKSSIGSNQLVTKSELNNQINQLTEQVSDFSSSLIITKQNLTQNIRDLVSKKLDAGVREGVLDNPANITSTGYYYFDSTTQGMPVRNGNNTTGIIQAIMQDDGNGILTILGSGLSIEKYRGQLYDRWKSSLPILLWKGRGQRGNTLELKDKIQNYGQLIIKLVFFTNRLATQFITVPDIGQTVYLNNIGMRALNDEFKNGYLDEISLSVKDERHIQILKTLTSTDNAIATNSDAIITAIYGIY